MSTNAKGLYLVATPIGTARDITLRALDILKTADIIAAEDTRRTRHLLRIHGIDLTGRRLISYHDHSGVAARKSMVEKARSGMSVALVSDAGTPLIADPGYRLVLEFRDAGLPVSAIPGPSSVTAAISVAGQPADQFFFAGFLPSKRPARRKALAHLSLQATTLVFLESPQRIADSLSDMSSLLGGERPATACRELTKKFEETIQSTLSELAREFVTRPSTKGEIVIVVGPSLAPVDADDLRLDRFLAPLLEKVSLRDAAELAASCLDTSRRRAYARAVSLKGKKSQHD